MLRLEAVDASAQLGVLLGGKRVRSTQLVEPAPELGQAGRWGNLQRGRRRRPADAGRRDRRGKHRAFVRVGIGVVAARGAAARGAAARVEGRDPDGTETSKLHERVLADRIEREASLELPDFGRPVALLRTPEGVASDAHGRLRGAEAFATRDVGSADRLERDATGRLPGRRLCALGVALGAGSLELGAAPLEDRRLGLGATRPLPGELRRDLGTSMSGLGAAALAVTLGPGGGKGLAAASELPDP